MQFPRISAFVKASVFLSFSLFALPSFSDWESDRIQFDVAGEGDPVLVIPGLTSSSDAFDEAFQNVGTKSAYHWAAIGGFAGTAAPADIEKFVAPLVEDMVGYIEDKNLENVSLIGHSMGGLVSLLAAAKTDKIEKVLVVDSVPFLAALMRPAVTPEQAMASGAQMREQFNSMTEEQYVAMMRQGIPIQVTSEEHKSLVWKDIERSDRGAVTAAITEIFSEDYRSVLPQIQVPVTVLVPHNQYSRDTAGSVLTKYKTLYAGLKNVEFKLVENSLHFIMLDQPEIFAQEVDLFLGEAASE